MKSLTFGFLAATVLVCVLPDVAEARGRHRDSEYSINFGYSSGRHYDGYHGGGHYHRSHRYVSPRHYDDCDYGGHSYYRSSRSYYRPRYYDYDRCYDAPRYYRRSSYRRYYCD